MRIGHGVDVHRVSDDPAKTLWLGLVAIPDAPGLEGHSDADVADARAVRRAAWRGQPRRSRAPLPRHRSGVRWRVVSSAAR